MHTFTPFKTLLPLAGLVLLLLAVARPSCAQPAFVGAPTVSGAPVCPQSTLQVTFAVNPELAELNLTYQVEFFLPPFSSYTVFNAVVPGTNSIQVPFGMTQSGTTGWVVRIRAATELFGTPLYTSGDSAP